MSATRRPGGHECGGGAEEVRHRDGKGGGGAEGEGHGPEGERLRVRAKALTGLCASRLFGK
eukprot:38400-Prorocentrum_minimum.AAC.8